MHVYRRWFRLVLSSFLRLFLKGWFSFSSFLDHQGELDQLWLEVRQLLLVEWLSENIFTEKTKAPNLVQVFVVLY